MYRKKKWLIPLAPLVAVGLFFLLPESFEEASGEVSTLSHAGRVTLALMFLMAVWWMSEAIPLYVTALLPLIVLPLCGVMSMKEAASPYAHELIFLFMGGFILALGIQKWQLHERIAFYVLRFVGVNPRRIVGGFMISTAFLSMWISNTASTILMVSIAMSVIRTCSGKGDISADAASGQFAQCLLLSIAYAASIGGTATLIGTPPNLFLASYLESQFDRSISFIEWMGAAMPLVLVFLPLSWLLMTRFLFPCRGEKTLKSESVKALLEKGQRPMVRGEKLIAAVFIITALAWVFRPLLNELSYLKY